MPDNDLDFLDGGDNGLGPQSQDNKGDDPFDYDIDESKPENEEKEPQGDSVVTTPDEVVEGNEEEEETYDDEPQTLKEKLLLPGLIAGGVVVLIVLAYVFWTFTEGRYRAAKNPTPQTTATQQQVWQVKPTSSPQPTSGQRKSLSDEVLNLEQQQAIMGQTIKGLNEKVNKLLAVLKVPQDSVQTKEFKDKMQQINKIIQQQQSNLNQKIASLEQQVKNNKKTLADTKATYQKAMAKFAAQNKIIKDKVLTRTKYWSLVGATLDKAIIKSKYGKVITVKVGTKVWGIGVVKDISAKRVIIGKYYVD